MCLTYYPVTFHDSSAGRCARRRFVADARAWRRRATGSSGSACGTGQQWLDFCVMVGHPEWMEDPQLFLDRGHLAPTIDAWIAEHTVDEVLDLAGAFRIPNAPIVNGANDPGDRALPRARNVRREPARRRRRTRPPYRFDPPLLAIRSRRRASASTRHRRRRRAPTPERAVRRRRCRSTGCASST